MLLANCGDLQKSGKLTLKLVLICGKKTDSHLIFTHFGKYKFTGEQCIVWRQMSFFGENNRFFWRVKSPPFSNLSAVFHTILRARNGHFSILVTPDFRWTYFLYMISMILMSMKLFDLHCHLLAATIFFYI